jgi:hypothetical protein
VKWQPEYTAKEALARTILLARDYVRPEDATDDEIVDALQSTVVAVVADERNATSASGQTAITTLAGLVTMMGVSLRLVIPRSAATNSQPPLEGNELVAGLQSVATQTIPGVVAEVANAPEPDDLVFVLGDTPYSAASTKSWRIFGDSAFGATGRAEVAAPRWIGESPFGALAAACIAAVEPFKAAMRQLRPTEFFDATPAAKVDLGPLPVTRSGADVGNLDIVSGGAITNAMLHTMLRVPNLRGRLRVIDSDIVHPSNLNRYPLMRRTDVGASKVSALSRYSTSALRIAGLPELFGNRTSSESANVAVGADQIPVRWAVQRRYLGWVGIGATSHWMAMASDHLPGEPCAGCVHPADDPSDAPIPTISFVSYWAGLALAAKLVRFALGTRSPPSETVVRISGLRLDGPFAFHTHKVHPMANCPVHCAASR